jgi:hypothetical protein
MNTMKSQVLPAPPNITKSLLAGFDTAANHLGLLVFSILLDGLLWFGPRLGLRNFFSSYLDWSIAITGNQSPQTTEFVRANREFLLKAIEPFNLFSAIRTLPVGIPSLFAGRLPLENPAGNPIGWEAPSLLGIIGIWLAMLLIGLGIGTLFFSVVSQAALQGKLSWQSVLERWPRNTGHVILLALFWFGLVLAASIPLSCILPFVMVSGGGISQILLFIYAAVLIWLLFPLLSSPFGIFIYQDSMWVSVLRGVRLVRLTLPTTLLFILSVLVLSLGLDMLWNIPAENSWLMLVGVVGHALVSTSVLAACFIYYVDAARYVYQKFQPAKSSSG